MCGPQIAKLVNITPISLDSETFSCILHGVYTPTTFWGPHCINVYFSNGILTEVGYKLGPKRGSWRRLGRFLSEFFLLLLSNILDDGKWPKFGPVQMLKAKMQMDIICVYIYILLYMFQLSYIISGYYCGWLRNPNHQLIDGLSMFIPFFLGFIHVSTISGGTGFLLSTVGLKKGDQLSQSERKWKFTTGCRKISWTVRRIVATWTPK